MHKYVNFEAGKPLYLVSFQSMSFILIPALLQTMPTIGCKYFLLFFLLMNCILFFFFNSRNFDLKWNQPLNKQGSGQTSTDQRRKRDESLMMNQSWIYPWIQVQMTWPMFQNCLRLELKRCVLDKTGLFIVIQLELWKKKKKIHKYSVMIK